MRRMVALSIFLVSFLMVTAAMQPARADELRQPQPGKKIKVFLFAGQSNMEGRADGHLLAEADLERLHQVQDRVQFAFNHHPLGPLSVATPEDDIRELYKIDLHFGPELFFGITMAEKYPDESFLLIKRTAGATSLYGAWNTAWSPDKTEAMGDQENPRLFEDFIGYLPEVLSGYQPEQYEICAMFWVQGEGDHKVEAAAASYKTNLQSLIAKAREAVQLPQLPFLLLDVGKDRVHEAMQQAAAEDPAVVLVARSLDPQSPDFYPQIPNGHYDHNGQKKLGERFVTDYLKFRDARK